MTHKGTIIDATFVTVPRRHTTKRDDEHLKAGEKLDDLPAKCLERIEKGEISSVEHVVSQIDMDARWAKKGEESFFGYKDQKTEEKTKKYRRHGQGLSIFLDI